MKTMIRQGHLEPSAPQARIEHLQFASMHLDEFFGDGETEPGTSELTAGSAFPLPESLEDHSAQLRFHSRPGIVDTNHHILVGHIESASDAALVRHELEGVGKQVHQNALELLGIYGAENIAGCLDPVVD